MILNDLHIQDFRNYENQTIHFANGTNILLGENAQGKTNILEAIYMLAIGKSHRVQKDLELMYWGKKQAFVEAKILSQHRNQTLKLQLTDTGRRASVNGVSMSKMTDFIGHFQVVLFAPEDLQLVKGGPTIRRKFIDMELGQTYPKYLYHLGLYNRSLQQRNALLKKQPLDAEHVQSFNYQIVEHGSQILHKRFSFIERIKDLSNHIYEQISDHRESLKIKYACSIPGIDFRSSLDSIRLTYEAALLQKQNNDAFVGYTTVGPHRDDMTFFLDDRSVQSFASQGQQRTIALSLRLAEIDFIHEEVGEYPVLLLDDVLSELDDMRQKNLIFTMSKKVQTILTTTSLFQLGTDLQSNARLFHVQSGIIQTEG